MISNDILAQVYGIFSQYAESIGSHHWLF